MKNILTRRSETLFNNFFVFQQNPKQGAHTRQAHCHHIRSRLVRGEAADFAGFPSARKQLVLDIWSGRVQLLDIQVFLT